MGKKIAVLLLIMALLASFAACKAEPVTDAVSSEQSAASSVESGVASTPEQTDNTSSVISSVSTETSKPAENSKPASSSKPQQTDRLFFASVLSEGAFGGGNAMALADADSQGLTAKRILARCAHEIFHSYVFDNMASVATRDFEWLVGFDTYEFKQYAVPSDVVFSVAEKFFVIDDSVKTMMKQSNLYDAATDKFWSYPTDMWFTGIDATVMGYEALSDSEYMLYVKAREINHTGPCSVCAANDSCVISSPLFKVKIKQNEKANNGFVILSFDFIAEIPSSVPKFN